MGNRLLCSAYKRRGDCFISVPFRVCWGYKNSHLFCKRWERYLYNQNLLLRNHFQHLASLSGRKQIPASNCVPHCREKPKRKQGGTATSSSYPKIITVYLVNFEEKRSLKVKLSPHKWMERKPSSFSNFDGINLCLVIRNLPAIEEGGGGYVLKGSPRFG